MTGNRSAVEPDIVLAGAGIMSATLGVFLKELEPSLNIEMFEMLGGAAQESSDAWNNAGTGHAANCELNYTPERSDGTIDISKAPVRRLPPPRLAGGINGSTCAHSSSVRSLGYLR